MKTLRHNNGGPLSNREFRRNERFRSQAERDARIATRRADDTEDLLDNLDNYYEKKDRDIAAKALGTMGTIGSLAKLAYMLEQRRRRALADRMRVDHSGYPSNYYLTEETDPSQPG